MSDIRLNDLLSQCVLVYKRSCQCCSICAYKRPPMCGDLHSQPRFKASLALWIVRRFALLARPAWVSALSLLRYSSRPSSSIVSTCYGSSCINWQCNAVPPIGARHCSLLLYNSCGLFRWLWWWHLSELSCGCQCCGEYTQPSSLQSYSILLQHEKNGILNNYWSFSYCWLVHSSFFILCILLIFFSTVLEWYSSNNCSRACLSLQLWPLFQLPPITWTIWPACCGEPGHWNWPKYCRWHHQVLVQGGSKLWLLRQGVPHEPVLLHLPTLHQGKHAVMLERTTNAVASRGPVLCNGTRISNLLITCICFVSCAHADGVVQSMWSWLCHRRVFRTARPLQQVLRPR